MGLESFLTRNFLTLKDIPTGMHFDIRTLLVAVALATAFCAAARVLLWRLHLGMPGLGQWAWAGVLGVPALILIAFHGAGFGHVWALPLAQLLIAVALALAWDGFRRFVGRTALSPWLWGALLSVVLLGWVVSHWDKSLLFRASFNTGLIAVLSALIARELLGATRPGQSAMRVTGWLYAFNSAFFLLRSLSVAAHGQVMGPLNPDGFAALSLFWWMGMTIAATLGMVLMTGERLQRNLDYQASRDPLTGALNRRAFSLVAEKEIALARRQGQPLSVLMLDLDHFKRVNDQLGHRGGDEILCRFVAVVKKVLRGEDLFCRFGGEEFVALLPGAEADQAMAVAERLRNAYRHESAAGYETLLPFALTVSIGVAEWRSGEDVERVILRADKALYRAKSGGRNRCELADQDQEDLPSPEPV